MENDNFMKKLWKSQTSGKYWGNKQQQKNYYENRMQPPGIMCGTHSTVCGKMLITPHTI